MVKKCRIGLFVAWAVARSLKRAGGIRGYVQRPILVKVNDHIGIRKRLTLPASE